MAYLEDREWKMCGYFCTSLHFSGTRFSGRYFAFIGHTNDDDSVLLQVMYFLLVIGPFVLHHSCHVHVLFQVCSVKPTYFNRKNSVPL